MHTKWGALGTQTQQYITISWDFRATRGLTNNFRDPVFIVANASSGRIEIDGFVESQYQIIEDTQAPVLQLLDLLSKKQLDFSPGGENHAVRELLGDLSVTQSISIETFRTFSAICTQQLRR